MLSQYSNHPLQKKELFETGILSGGGIFVPLDTLFVFAADSFQRQRGMLDGNKSSPVHCVTVSYFQRQKLLEDVQLHAYNQWTSGTYMYVCKSVLDRCS